MRYISVVEARIYWVFSGWVPLSISQIGPQIGPRTYVLVRSETKSKQRSGLLHMRPIPTIVHSSSPAELCFPMSLVPVTTNAPLLGDVTGRRGDPQLPEHVAATRSKQSRRDWRHRFLR
jgi:hypothetical protein